jgi:hypothetical protein
VFVLTGSPGGSSRTVGCLVFLLDEQTPRRAYLGSLRPPRPQSLDRRSLFSSSWVCVCSQTLFEGAGKRAEADSSAERPNVFCESDKVTYKGASFRLIGVDRSARIATDLPYDLYRSLRTSSFLFGLVFPGPENVDEPPFHLQRVVLWIVFGPVRVVILRTSPHIDLHNS